LHIHPLSPQGLGPFASLKDGLVHHRPPLLLLLFLLLVLVLLLLLLLFLMTAAGGSEFDSLLAPLHIRPLLLFGWWCERWWCE